MGSAHAAGRVAGRPGLVWRSGVLSLIAIGLLAVAGPTSARADTVASCDPSADASCCQPVDSGQPAPDPSVCCPVVPAGTDLDGDGVPDCPASDPSDGDSGSDDGAWWEGREGTGVRPPDDGGGGGSTATDSGTTGTVTTSSTTTGTASSGTVGSDSASAQEESFTAQHGSLPPLPDPLPSGKRLDASWTLAVARIARAHDVDWALVLATIRARGYEGPSPISLDAVRALVRQLARAGAGKQGLVAFARGYFSADLYHEVVALTRYNHAVGLKGLVNGLEAVKTRLQNRVLRSDRLAIYPGGRSDIAGGNVDVRVLTLLLYLSQKHDSVTVSCLITGHSFFVDTADASPGTPSLHSFGRAVDISAIDGVSILGSQEPGGLTERVLREIMALPQELQPSELISLFSLGGSSFALADHADHIHVGF